jgi:single-strand DNA-binding protein
VLDNFRSGLGKGEEMNHVAIAGNLGVDATLKYTTGGKPVANLFILVDNGFGAAKKSPFGFAVVAWDETAEFAGKLTKGTKVSVYGKLTSRKYQNKAGVDVTVVEVVADAISAWKGKDVQKTDRPQTQVADDDIPF